MKFTQPKLPYAQDALAPVISPLTIEYHYGKHEKAYIDTLNKLIAGTEFEDMALEDIIVKSEGKLFNNASQAWNHIFYFFQFSPMVLKSRQDLCAIRSRSNSAVLMNSSISLKRQALPYSVPDGYGWQSITTTSSASSKGKMLRTL